jgi:hypothetical protein
MTIFELNELIGRCQSGGRPSSVVAADEIRQAFRDMQERLEVLTPLEGTPAEIVAGELRGLDEDWSVEEVTSRIVGALYASGHIS